MEHRIQIRHKYQRNFCFLPQVLYHVKNIVGGHTAGKRPDIRLLNDWSLSDRIGKRNADLDQICACPLHFQNVFLCLIKGRISRRQKCNKCLFIFKCLLDSAHLFPSVFRTAFPAGFCACQSLLLSSVFRVYSEISSPRYLAIAATSLSPRPDRQMMID